MRKKGRQGKERRGGRQERKEKVKEEKERKAKKGRKGRKGKRKKRRKGKEKRKKRRRRKKRETKGGKERKEKDMEEKLLKEKLITEQGRQHGLLLSSSDVKTAWKMSSKYSGILQQRGPTFFCYKRIFYIGNLYIEEIPSKIITGKLPTVLDPVKPGMRKR